MIYRRSDSNKKGAVLFLCFKLNHIFAFSFCSFTHLNLIKQKKQYRILFKVK